jgi:hypothetical protein
MLADNSLKTRPDIINENVFITEKGQLITAPKNIRSALDSYIKEQNQGASVLTITPIKGGDPSTFDKPQIKTAVPTNLNIKSAGVFSSTIQIFKTKPLIAYPIAIAVLGGIGYSVIKSQQK